jgi:hypothetical protein
MKTLLPGEICREHYDLVSQGFEWSQIEKLVPFLSPYLNSCDELVGTKVVDGKLRFLLLGSVRKVARIL